MTSTSISLIIHGYLKPNEFGIQAKNATEKLFMQTYTIMYLLIASSLIVNFLVTIINDINAKNEQKNEPDILSFLTSVTKRPKKTPKAEVLVRNIMRRKYKLYSTME